MIQPRTARPSHWYTYHLMFYLVTALLTQNSLAADTKKIETQKSATLSSSNQGGVGSILDELNRVEVRLMETESELLSSRAKLRKARQRRYPRGQALDSLRSAADEDAIQTEKVEDLFLHLVEKARRQGIPVKELSPFIERAEVIEDSRIMRTP